MNEMNKYTYECNKLLLNISKTKYRLIKLYYLLLITYYYYYYFLLNILINVKIYNNIYLDTTLVVDKYIWRA